MRVARRVIAIVLFISVAALSLANCMSDNSTHSTGDQSLQAPNVASTAQNSDEYKIAPRDLLQLTVFQVPDMNKTAQVDGAGVISLPLIGNTKVGGKTINQAEDEIRTKLGKKYLQSPQVSPSLVKSGQRVTVNGAVKNPTVITIDGVLTLSQAIAQTGGLSEIGNGGRVHLARMSGQSVKDQVFNINEIQSGNVPDPALYGGDIVVVEESGTKVAFKNIRDLLPFAVLGSLLSDVRVKRDLMPLVQLANGLTLYRYRYHWSNTIYVGVLAQEVELTVPEAVSEGADGYLRVNYSQLGIELQTCAEWMASRKSPSCL